MAKPDLTNVTSISVYKSRRDNPLFPKTEEEAAKWRGYCAWKRANWKREPKEPVAHRPWPPQKT